MTICSPQSQYNTSEGCVMPHVCIEVVTASPHHELRNMSAAASIMKFVTKHVHKYKKYREFVVLAKNVATLSWISNIVFSVRARI